MLGRYRLWSWEERQRQGGGRLKVITLSIFHQMLTHTNRRMVMANGKKTHSYCRLAKHCRSALQLHMSILLPLLEDYYSTGDRALDTCSERVR